ncbi:chemotaxis protein MotB [Lutimaribacter sp. EGI FJ00015]|uniref:Chemotaxis protein MotB n=1 Tax=Lutimaribacter degradans TaxID=2945989 RepID=A0ACC5ZVP6_9RHOB|nr:flagellar motor protein MotB [Lutimaribacter sp. EGI FJ00013]MCM2561920.1 chemotaxis protein MotB [Lutimaribacter sp. EGI FJ00013]MCO0613048.1 chemotaxis protein MotB [Lutimaribacter sp. EGI FJ00015]MCO0635752.1 chemotaxis protein MotB [Lutimaribacter sp. EGI FJ00014]
MGAQGNAVPVIIKRKKVIRGDGHHGGAWKVAYADFVTAMMAFFLLMWLLNATTEKQRKGIADYFTPTVPMARVSGGGEGIFGGNSVFSEEVLPRNGTGATNLRPTEENKARGESGVSETDRETGAEEEAFKVVEAALMGRGGESMVHDDHLKHILTRVTDEGLVVEVFDLEGAPLFQGATAQPTALLQELSAMLSRVFALVQNPLAIEGHVAARPLVLVDNPVWPLSVDRANVTRGLIEGQEFPVDRIRRVTGHADREPATQNPMSIRNNRLELVLLRTSR